MDSSNLCHCPESLAMASIPKQEWCEPYDLQAALAEGTLFPCLNMTFYKAPSGTYKCPTCSSMSDTSQKKP